MANTARKSRSVYDRFPPPKFKVGDWVRMTITPWYTPTVQIIEYRGPLGVGGEHIYRFRESDEYGEVRVSEMVESALELIAPPASK